MWKPYRLGKRLLFFPLIALTLLVMKGAPELSPRWVTGMVIAALLAIAYLADEIAWMIQRKQRPCGNCGKPVPLKSFRVAMACPHCGRDFE